MELTSFEQHKKEIKTTMQEELGINLLEPSKTKTPFQIMQNIRRQERNPNLQPQQEHSPDRPQEIEKKPPKLQYSYKLEVERHYLKKRSLPESEKQPLLKHTLKVTHKEMQQQKYLEQQKKTLNDILNEAEKKQISKEESVESIIETETDNLRTVR